ncbi:hypothetical protein DOT_0343 [Desulfosporosinus sp. OT]|nr:hypothetical protein DOT_0343 [Desulfosporosinus sp. OT]
MQGYSLLNKFAIGQVAKEVSHINVIPDVFAFELHQRRCLITAAV